MDVIRKSPNSENAFLAVTKSTNFHILVFYWNGSDIECKWFLRDSATSDYQIADVSPIHMAMVDFQLTDVNGRRHLKTPFETKFDLYFETSPNGHAIVFDKEGRCQMTEIFVDIPSQKAFCRCKSSAREFVEIVDTQFGPLMSFF